jgi:hypothetical protein
MWVLWWVLSGTRSSETSRREQRYVFAIRWMQLLDLVLSYKAAFSMALIVLAVSCGVYVCENSVTISSDPAF